MSRTDADLYYDPYDFEIDTDPYPIWRRMREEAPLYWNDRYEFFALSRFDDVEWYGETVPEGSVMVLINASANRDDRHFPSGDSFDIHRRIDHHLSSG
jgi:cytochrome P450